MQEWYSLQELATAWNVDRKRVQNTVAVLRRGGFISTRRNPQDEREVQVHRDSVESVKNAILADDGSATA